MNNADRKKTQRSLDIIEKELATVLELVESEQEKFTNLSPGLQATANGQKLKANAQAYLDAYDSIEKGVNDMGSLIE